MLGLAVSHRSFRSDVSLAFLGCWVAHKAGRVFYLGQRPDVLLHQLNVGSLILFTFFMISDPKATPDRRAARLLFAACVAGLAFVLQHGFWWNNALVWSLCLLSPAVPLLDRFLTAVRFQLPAERTEECPSARCALAVTLNALALLAAPQAADAFCGFYIGKADSQLFNQASQVVLVRNGERTVVTMSNDYKGELTDFTLVVPVPTVLQCERLHAGERKYIEWLDAYSSPRLVEDFDEDRARSATWRSGAWRPPPPRRCRRGTGTTREPGCSASRSRPSIPWVSTTSSSSPPSSPTAWRRGCARAATRFRRARPPRSSRT